MPSSSCTQGCLDDTQICMSGLKSAGSSSVADVTPMTPPAFRRENSGVPHSGQEPRSMASEEANQFTLPVTLRSSIRNRRRALKAAPIAFWHSRQWHTRSLIGASVHS